MLRTLSAFLPDSILNCATLWQIGNGSRLPVKSNRIMQVSASYSIAGWCGIAGGIVTRQDWSLWAKNKLEIHPTLPKPKVKTIPSQILRRVDTLGRCVMFVCEQCIPLIKAEPAIVAVSRHGDLSSTDKLIECVRACEDISPTAFAYSVHNRFSSLVSMLADYRGVNGAYSSVRDGFPLALSEATALIAEHQALQVLVIAYESEIPEAYYPVISHPWTPHVVAFVLQKADDTKARYSLLRHANRVADTVDNGTCLPLIRTMLHKANHRDGFWEHQHDK